LRVLVVQLSAGWAGTERHAVELANELSSHLDVAILLRARPRERHRHAEYAALRASIAPGIPVYLSSRATPCFGLWRAIARFRPDLIHAHHERSARVAALWARPLGIPVIATIHMRYRAVDYARCDALIALNEAERARAAAAFRGEVVLIENWVVPWPRPDPARINALRRELGIDAGDFVIGSIGRLAHVKRIDGLIAAFAAADLPRSRLIIVGDGGERAALEANGAARGLGDRVRFAGFRADARDFYALFDLFVLNSAYDPYPLVILEAAEQRLKVIATATAGAQMMAANLPLTLIEIDSPTALTEALRAGYAARAEPAPVFSGFALADRLPDILALYRRSCR